MTSKTKAIKRARSHISGLYGSNAHGYEIYGPYRNIDPDGPTTSIKAVDYHDAVSKRKQWVARLALVIMGYDDMDAYDAVHGDYEGSVENIISRAVMRLDK